MGKAVEKLLDLLVFQVELEPYFYVKSLEF